MQSDYKGKVLFFLNLAQKRGLFVDAKDYTVASPQLNRLFFLEIESLFHTDFPSASCEMLGILVVLTPPKKKKTLRTCSFFGRDITIISDY